MSLFHRLRQPPRLGDDDQLQAPTDTDWYDSSGWSNRAGIGSNRPSYVSLWNDISKPSWHGRNVPLTREVAQGEPEDVTSPPISVDIPTTGPSRNYQGVRIDFSDNTPETLHVPVRQFGARVGYLAPKINTGGIDRNYRGTKEVFASPSGSESTSSTSDWHSAEWVEQHSYGDTPSPQPIARESQSDADTPPVAQAFRKTAVERRYGTAYPAPVINREGTSSNYAGVRTVFESTPPTPQINMPLDAPHVNERRGSKHGKRNARKKLKKKAQSEEAKAEAFMKILDEMSED